MSLFLSDNFSKVTKSLSNQGFSKTIALIGMNVMHLIRLHADGRFDRIHGTDTSGVIVLDGLEIAGPNRGNGEYFIATGTKIFNSLLAQLEIQYENFVFIDFGSGKGRNLLLASHYPFRKIIGVEFSPEFHHCAESNIALYHPAGQRCFSIESICIDAVEFDIPIEPCVLYFFHPFDEVIFEVVLHKVSESLAKMDRPVVLVYYDPVKPYVIEQHSFSRFKRIAKVPFDISNPPSDRHAIIYSNRPLKGFNTSNQQREGK